MTHYDHLEQIVNFTTDGDTHDIWPAIAKYVDLHPDTRYRSDEINYGSYILVLQLH